jgi:chromosome condensin MukBEF ATPase and DNA-binding subunit MukB
MFKLNEFIKKGLLNAVGKMADYQIILNATGWYEKSVLTMEDLAEINAKIEEQYAVVENVENEEIVNE